MPNLEDLKRELVILESAIKIFLMHEPERAIKIRLRIEEIERFIHESNKDN